MTIAAGAIRTIAGNGLEPPYDNGLAIGAASIYFWSEETWGPRYVHAAVAPLIICLALARKGVRFRLRKEIPLAALAACGLAVSFLGAFFRYDGELWIAMKNPPGTLEMLQYDINWNPILFDARLLAVWLRGPASPPADSDLWPLEYHGWIGYEPPETRPSSLKEFAVPQAILVRHWSKRETGLDVVSWWVCLLSLVAGPLLLGWLGYRCLKPDGDGPGLPPAVQ